MGGIPVQDVRVLVLSGEQSTKAQGSLFESFLARLLADEYGFEQPTTSSLNVTAEGVELDVTATHKLTRSKALAECKAYARNVAAHELTNFYGKLGVARFEDATTFGLMCALPRLTAEGEEKARSIEAHDTNFRYVNAEMLAAQLERAGLIGQAPNHLTDVSDRAILITDVGIYSAALVLDPEQRTPQRVAVWGAAGSVPDAVLDLVAASDYALSLQVTNAHAEVASRVDDAGPATAAPLITQVVGSTSDFEYQLPASPKFFVGRTTAVRDLGALLANTTGSVFVLNAQSGWGKSSLALKIRDVAERQRGVGLAFDTRTAEGPRYVVEVLRQAGLAAQDAGILTLPDDASWGSLESAIATLRAAVWTEPQRPIVVIFDQFENVFANVGLTRVFRDLALAIREIRGPFVVGFAWKTDLVGWTEGHPFQLRDDIRGAGRLIRIEPFGSQEVEVILRRLARELGVRLLPDLRAKLKAYSQGLPWLLKKLADHVLRELRGGVTQEDLLAESLNVVSLFETDLRELSAGEITVLKHVARFAPTPAIEVTERFGPDAVQSLVDRRLLVQVGDLLDTYWDTFRDFLNTGNVPIEESYILRQTPTSVGRLLRAVVDRGGDASVEELVEALGTSDRAIFNLSRELRLLGVSAYTPNRVRLVDDVANARNREPELRRIVATSLRKHRAYSALKDLAERGGGFVTLDSYSRELPRAFPAVGVSPIAWQHYARAFLWWMEYAGLVMRHGSQYQPVTEAAATPAIELLTSGGRRGRNPAGVPQTNVGPALEVLAMLGTSDGSIQHPDVAKHQKAVFALRAIGAVQVTDEGVHLIERDLVDSAGTIDPAVLRRLLEAKAGGAAAIEALETDPAASAEQLGQAIADASGVGWADSTRLSIGGVMRSWVKAAGVEVKKAPRRRKLGSPDSAHDGFPGVE